MEILDEYPFLLKHENFQKREVKSLKMYLTSIHDGERDQLRSEPNIIANFHDNGYLKSYGFFDNRGKPIEAADFDLNGYKIRYKNRDNQSSVWQTTYEIQNNFDGEKLIEKQIMLKTIFYHLLIPGKIIKEETKPHKKEIYKYNWNNEIVEIETIDLQNETPKTCYKKEYIYNNPRDYIVIEYEYSEHENKLIKIAKTHNIFDENGNLLEQMILSGYYELIEDKDNYSTHLVYKYGDDGNLIERFYYSYKELRGHDTYVYDSNLVIKIEEEYNGKLSGNISIKYES